jgi:hypothetical protein
MCDFLGTNSEKVRVNATPDGPTDGPTFICQSYQSKAVLMLLMLRRIISRIIRNIICISVMIMYLLNIV